VARSGGFGDFMIENRDMAAADRAQHVRHAIIPSWRCATSQATRVRDATQMSSRAAQAPYVHACVQARQCGKALTHADAPQVAACVRVVQARSVPE
jgi:hypothetical protein